MSLKPDRQDHEDQLASPSTNGVALVIRILVPVLLIVFPIISLALVLYALGGYSLPGEWVCEVPVLFLLAGFAVLQAYRGIVKREIVLPVRHGASARYLYYGEKAEPKITGNAAVCVGVFWVFLVLFFVGTAIRILVMHFLSQ